MAKKIDCRLKRNKKLSQCKKGQPRIKGRCKRIPESLEKFAIFVADDDREVMLSALHPTSGLDRENKRMNRVAIKRLSRAIDKINDNKPLNKIELSQIDEANQIHLSDGKPQAKKLDTFLRRGSYTQC